MVRKDNASMGAPDCRAAFHAQRASVLFEKVNPNSRTPRSSLRRAGRGSAAGGGRSGGATAAGGRGTERFGGLGWSPGRSSDEPSLERRRPSGGFGSPGVGGAWALTSACEARPRWRCRGSRDTCRDPEKTGALPRHGKAPQAAQPRAQGARCRDGRPPRESSAQRCDRPMPSLERVAR